MPVDDLKHNSEYLYQTNEIHLFAVCRRPHCKTQRVFVSVEWVNVGGYICVFFMCFSRKLSFDDVGLT